MVAEANLRQAERNWKRAKALGVSEALSQASYDSYLSAWEQAPPKSAWRRRRYFPPTPK